MKSYYLQADLITFGLLCCVILIEQNWVSGGGKVSDQSERKNIEIRHMFSNFTQSQSILFRPI